MLAREALLALVDVLRAVNALIAGRTRADVASVDGRGVAHGAGVARAAGTRVVQVAQQASLSREHTRKNKYMSLYGYFPVSRR